MGFLNTKCIAVLVLAVVAMWNFPFGALIDVGIITAWVAIKVRGKHGGSQGGNGGWRYPSRRRWLFPGRGPRGWNPATMAHFPRDRGLHDAFSGDDDVAFYSKDFLQELDE